MENQPLIKTSIKTKTTRYLKKLTKRFLVPLAIGTFFVLIISCKIDPISANKLCKEDDVEIDEITELCSSRLCIIS